MTQVLSVVKRNYLLFGIFSLVIKSQYMHYELINRTNER